VSRGFGRWVRVGGRRVVLKSSPGGWRWMRDSRTGICSNHLDLASEGCVPVWGRTWRLCCHVVVPLGACRVRNNCCEAARRPSPTPSIPLPTFSRHGVLHFSGTRLTSRPSARSPSPSDATFSPPRPTTRSIAMTMSTSGPSRSRTCTRTTRLCSSSRPPGSGSEYGAARRGLGRDRILVSVRWPADAPVSGCCPKRRTHLLTGSFSAV
jgi:hypothetical protein